MNVGVIGAGHWGSLLIKKFESIVKGLDKDSMVYYHDPLVSLNSNIFFGNKRDMFDNVDIVVVATPAEFLYEEAKTALQEGKHVFCEKPILHQDYLYELYAIALDNDVTFFVDNLYLYNENVKLFGEVIGDKSIRHIDVDWYNGYLPRKNVNVFVDLAWHPLNIIYALLSNSRYITENIKTVKSFDFVTLFARLGNTSVSCKFSWLDREKVRRINVRTCDGFNYIWDEIGRIIVIFDNKGKEQTADFVEDNPLENSINAFIRNVWEGRNLSHIGVTGWTTQFIENINNIK